jgi:putative hemolysin
MKLKEHEATQTLISPKEVKNLIKMKGMAAEKAGGAIMSALGFNRLNELYIKHANKKGLPFIEAVLAELEIQYEINRDELKRVPQKGAFVIVSNHPYGGIEGLILLKEILPLRPDFKIIGNFLFHRIKPLKDYIFPVNPFETHKKEKSSIAGLKDALQHLSDGKPLLIFPAGEVSTIYIGSNEVADRKWMNPALKFIKKAKVAVLPVHFQGSNSILFHSLGFIHPLLRTAKIPSELFNKKNKIIKIRIGNAISVAEQNEYAEVERYGRFLRAKTYMLGTLVEVKRFFKPAHKFPVKQETIVDAIDKQLLKDEIELLPPDCLLFKQVNYSVYCAGALKIPKVLCEIGRLRELTFRAVGEGTNRKTDVDEYDLYYNHLFLWDESTHSIAGAYRIGMGKEILHNYGVKGFYLRSLFKMKKEFVPVLNESIELGRSFIVKEFQRTPLPLFLLWKGILHFLVRNLDYRYLIGPVSISNSFSNLSKSMIVDFITKKHFNNDLAKYVKPKKRFRVKLNRDARRITKNVKTLKDIDHIVKDIESDNRFPVLLRKYIELNGKIICFNIDPKFNDALDGLLVLDLFNIPEETIQMLSKEMDNNLLKSRFHFMNDLTLEYNEFNVVPQL